MSTGSNQGVTRSQNNLYNALLLSQAKGQANKAKDQFKQLSEEHQKVITEHQKVAKKYADLEKQHKETKKELHKYKLQFDGNYAFENKQSRKEAMAKVRAAKTKKRQTVTARSQEARKAARIKARTRK